MPSGETKKKQRKYYSGKKKQHTVKGQIVVDSNLRIVCTAIAMTNTHDFKLFKQSRLPIKKKTLVCVDTGYLGLCKLHSNTEIPKKKTKLNPLSKDDKLENKIKSSKRIPIEHINAKIKTFKIVAQKYRNRRKRFGLRFNLICALINFDRGFAVK
jgi:hypothetical protein